MTIIIEIILLFWIYFVNNVINFDSCRIWIINQIIIYFIIYFLIQRSFWFIIWVTRILLVCGWCIWWVAIFKWNIIWVVSRWRIQITIFLWSIWIIIILWSIWIIRRWVIIRSWNIYLISVPISRWIIWIGICRCRIHLTCLVNRIHCIHHI